MFIHDVPPLMFESNYYLMPNYIDMYNQSGFGRWVPSEQMYHRLVSEGLTRKICGPKLWDLTHSLISMFKIWEKTDLLRKSFTFHISSIGIWDTLHVYTEPVEGVDSKIHMEGWRTKQELLLELSKGGFGLVWGNFENLRMSGITKKIFPTNYRPIYSYVVCQTICQMQTIFEKKGQLCSSSLEGFNRLVQDCTEEEHV